RAQSCGCTASHPDAEWSAKPRSRRVRRHCQVGSIATDQQGQNTMSFKLAHLSDIHLGPLPDVQMHELMSKRITGYVNWQRNRKAHLDNGIIDALCTDLLSQAPDHIAVTGDL